MEIFGYVIEGSCHHVDSLGNDVEVPAGGVQRMSSGTGIFHTEGNSSDTPNRYLQLWIRPQELDTEPDYAWHQFTRRDKLDRFCDVTERLPIKQNARLLAGIFTREYDFAMDLKRHYYMYVVSGKANIQSINVVEGDGLSFVREGLIKIIPATETEIILFDLR
jgi:redox-sensitive bicupin YhaK (pirin superfamily)